ncbi:hypothetical protein CBER1_10575 [Cercospora berteroae]|uniref:3-hydroxyphenylacetate 6-hydroxylase n=1 Tax=Cercospora berteroae TaxID=357750 RepID=A0A2S6BY74_9PEZI|nr:hypothetical protein CBER1_10575 [Cercospora berteroae]
MVSIEELWPTPLRLQILFIVASVFTFSLITYECIRRKSLLSGFGGPWGLPIVGNLLSIGEDAAESYRVWARTYGEVYQVQLGSIPVLVIVSDTSGTTIGTAPFNDSLKKRRKIAASALNKPAVQTYVPQLDMETKLFIDELWKVGDHGSASISPIPMIQRLNMSLTLTMNWGRRMESQSNKLFGRITHVEDELSKFRRTNANLQDYIPLLRLNPLNVDSVKAREMRTRRDKYMKVLDDELHEKLAKGEVNPCIQVNVLQEGGSQLTKCEITSINVTMLAAGLDTMISAVSWEMVCLATQPDIQTAAVKAIGEHFTEQQPLCDANDDQSCKYIVGFVKETLRFYTMARLSLPRRSTRDTFFDDKLIPAGTIVFLNAWAYNHDPTVWKDLDEFRPERWVEDNDNELRHYTLGAGSRMCIGIHLAYRELYLIFIRLLNSFELIPGGDVDAHPLTGQDDPSALTTQPKPFKVKFVPRNTAALIQALAGSE